MTTPFDWISDVSDKKQNLFEQGEKGYNPFLVNRGLSYFSDCIMYSQKMNMCSHLSPEMQHAYYFFSLKKRKRYSKWAKSDRDEKIVMDVARTYQINPKRAEEVLAILNEDQKDYITKMREYDNAQEDNS